MAMYHFVKFKNFIYLIYTTIMLDSKKWDMFNTRNNTDVGSTTFLK